MLIIFIINIQLLYTYTHCMQYALSRTIYTHTYYILILYYIIYRLLEVTMLKKFGPAELGQHLPLNFPLFSALFSPYFRILISA